MDFLAGNLASFPRAVRKNGTEVAHRLDKLLKRKPNDYQDATTFWRTLFFHRSHYLNAFAEIERDKLFNVAALHNRLPEQTAPFRYLDDDGNISQWYFVGGFRPHVVNFADMIHLSGLSYDGIGGFNPVFVLAEAFERSRLLDRYVTRFLVKGSVVRGSIEIPAGASKDQQETIVNTLRKKFQGADAESDLLVLSDGATLNNKTLSPQESQLIEQANYATKQIAQITGVPPHFLFDDSEGKYNSNPAQAGEDVVKWCFRTRIEEAEDQLAKLLTDQEQDGGFTIHLDPTCLLRGDVVSMSNVVTQQISQRVITPNEGRKVLGYPESDDPQADTLKLAGDTSPAAPQIPDMPVKNAAQNNLEQFGAVIADAAQRVETKTEKATATARQKFSNDPEGWVRWSNVFTTEQAGYVAAALEPIAETIRDTGYECPIDPADIGERYAAQVRTYHARMIRGEESTPPALTILIDSKGAE